MFALTFLPRTGSSRHDDMYAHPGLVNVDVASSNGESSCPSMGFQNATDITEFRLRWAGENTGDQLVELSQRLSLAIVSHTVPFCVTAVLLQISLEEL